MAELYDREYERTGIKMKGYVTVQKKMLTTMYALWRKNEAFDASYQQQHQKTTAQETKTASDDEAEFSSLRHSCPALLSRLIVTRLLIFPELARIGATFSPLVKCFPVAQAFISTPTPLTICRKL